MPGEVLEKAPSGYANVLLLYFGLQARALNSTGLGQARPTKPRFSDVTNPSNLSLTILGHSAARQSGPAKTAAQPW